VPSLRCRSCGPTHRGCCQTEAGLGFRKLLRPSCARARGVNVDNINVDLKRSSSRAREGRLGFFKTDIIRLDFPQRPRALHLMVQQGIPYLANPKRPGSRRKTRPYWASPVLTTPMSYAMGPELTGRWAVALRREYTTNHRTHRPSKKAQAIELSEF